MTSQPSWPPPGQDAAGRWRTEGAGGGYGFATYRNLLSVAPFDGGGISPSDITLRFQSGPLHVAVEPTASSLDQYVEIVRKRLRRGRYSCGPVSQAPVAGFPDGRVQVVTKKRGRGSPAGLPQLQCYTLAGPYAVLLNVAQAQAGLAQAFGPIQVYPGSPPAITPIVQLPVSDPASVEERLTVNQAGVRLTAVAAAGQVTASAEEYAVTSLATIMSNTRNMTVGDRQQDVFLGGWPCLRHTFVHTGGSSISSPVRSEFWWAGVVAGRGIQIFALGTKSIIDVGQARQMTNLVGLIPPG
jgi:hypothetical protein